MSKRVLDVGNCGPDHVSLTQLVQGNFSAAIDQAHGMEEALEMLRQAHYDLVLVNRLMDRDGSEGLEIIKAIKSDSVLSDMPVMMITNYDNHQQVAISAGAEPGFGKSNLFSPQTIERLRAYLA